MPLNGGKGHGGANGNANGATDLAGLDMNAPTPAEPKMLKPPNLASAAHLSPGWEKGFDRLILRSEGVLYEDGQVQIGVRSEYRGQMACLIAYFTNKTPGAMTSFTTTLDLDEAEKGKLTWDVKNLPESTIAPGAQSQQVTMFEAKRVFDKSPTIRVSYLAGALQALTLKLPVAIHKFMDPADLSAEDFFKRWKQIGAGLARHRRSLGWLQERAVGGRLRNGSSTRRLKASDGACWTWWTRIPRTLWEPASCTPRKVASLAVSCGWSRTTAVR